MLVEGSHEVALPVLWVEEHHWPDQGPLGIQVDTPTQWVWPLKSILALFSEVNPSSLMGEKPQESSIA